jgi:hypothetical protein
VDELAYSCSSVLVAAVFILIVESHARAKSTPRVRTLSSSLCAGYASISSLDISIYNIIYVASSLILLAY